ncbi:MAG: ribose 5-phosphate isomerase B [Bacteroidetes bacterium]|jgi:ribose 5-phosphate isomerase B|nr:ribose 5-phosphate isomerase B [Bacteroidota bacterium]
MSLKIAIGGDHAGFEYKKKILNWLQSQNFQTSDFGPYTADSMDYPDTVHPLATAVEKKEFDFGILICGSGNGVCITANKHQGIRAGLVWNNNVAKLIRQHNDANIMCLPARFIDDEEALLYVKTFIETAFEGGRHATRVGKIPC